MYHPAIQGWADADKEYPKYLTGKKADLFRNLPVI